MSGVWEQFGKKNVREFEENIEIRKRLRKPERSEVDDSLLKLFRQKRSGNVRASGPLFTTKPRHLRRS